MSLRRPGKTQNMDSDQASGFTRAYTASQTQFRASDGVLVLENSAPALVPHLLNIAEANKLSRVKRALGTTSVFHLVEGGRLVIQVD